jgi:hypothetical protein
MDRIASLATLCILFVAANRLDAAQPYTIVDTGQVLCYDERGDRASGT